MTTRKSKIFAYLDDEDYQKLEHMSIDDRLSRSRFISKLIRNEWIRRYSKPNPAVSVEDAKAAGAAVASVPAGVPASVPGEAAKDAHGVSVPVTVVE